MAVEYFANNLMPGRVFFRCERMRASLAVDSCAIMWRRENDNNEAQHPACRLCQLGAIHAGEVAASMSPLKGTPTCARCHRQATRLIKKMICVSCSNRESEWVKGRNAKGTKPVKHPPMAPRRLYFCAGGEPGYLRLQLSVDMDELIIATLRDSRQKPVFGFRVPVPPAIRQARLF